MKFYVDDVPDELSIFGYIKSQLTDWDQAIEIVPKRNYKSQLQFRIEDFDSCSILNSVYDAFRIYGEHGWKNTNGQSKDYTGFSLVYNPYHREHSDAHSSTLGTHHNSPSEFFYAATKHHNALKNSYFDTLGFCIPTPASQHASLGKFLSRRKRTMIRGRCSSINGAEYIDHPNLGWHKDEIIFQNLRINIPLVTADHYFFQMQDNDPVHLDIGYAYSWDTNIAHRVYNTIKSNDRRIHLVIGMSPWLDYDPTDFSWSTNEFYGIKHPFDMLVDGDVFSGLNYVV